MRAWFSLRVGIVAIVLAVAYAPFVWFAVYFGVKPEYILTAIGFTLFIQYVIGTKRAIRDANAMKLDENNPDFDDLRQSTRELANRLNVPEPTLWVSNMGSPNAFAIGRKGNGHIVLDVALFELLTPREIQAVIAHELSHIRSRDIIPMVVGSGGATIVYYLLASFENLFHSHTNTNSLAGRLGHAVMMGFVFMISREREYIADADAKWAVGSGEPLASALLKIEQSYQQGLSNDPPDGVEAFCISGHWSLPALGATHPDTTDRITELRQD